jgi:cell division protein FtsW (lipid II flippase)
MRSPLVPVALFVTLVLSVVVVLPLAGSAFVSLAFFGFMASLGGLAWWVVCADDNVAAAAAGVPVTGPMPLAAEMLHEDDVPLEQDWDAFEADFWTHVAEQETHWGSD